ncbi:MAG: hypothetical protein ACFFAN_13960, partial [Promethearchaeota archaeon]
MINSISISGIIGGKGRHPMRSPNKLMKKGLGEILFDLAISFIQIRGVCWSKDASVEIPHLKST